MLFELFARSKPQTEAVADTGCGDPVTRAALNVAARFGRGNVAAQQGRILTAERLEREREMLRQAVSSR